MPTGGDSARYVVGIGPIISRGGSPSATANPIKPTKPTKGINPVEVMNEGRGYAVGVVCRVPRGQQLRRRVFVVFNVH